MDQDSEKSKTSQNQFVHRMIPTVTAVSLTLGASACGGSGGADRPSDEELRDYCSDLRSCVGEQDFDFDSVDDCVSQVDEEIRYYTELAREESGQACVDATLEVFNCLIGESVCEMGYFSSVYDVCADEYYAQEDICGSYAPGGM